jgi:hypothetical protein
MATKGIYFGGRTILVPGAYAQGDASALVEIAVGALNVVMVVGEAAGGEPLKPLVFNAAASDRAAAVLRSGPLLEAMNAAWNPSPSTPGADVVIGVRVNPAVRAQRAMLDGQDPAQTALTVKARDWGQHGNGTQVAVLAGTVNPEHRVVVIKKVSDGLDQRSPELGNVLGLAYTGNGTATVMVYMLDGVPTLEVAVTGATDGSASFVKALTDPDVETIAKLAAWLTAQTGVSVKIYGAETMASAQLDPLFAPQGLSASPVPLTAVNGAVCDWINRFSPAAVAEFGSNASPVAPTGPVFLAGGADNPPTMAQWTQALKALETQPGYFLVPATGDEAIHQACLDHVLRMSDIKVKRRRQLFVGCEPGIPEFLPTGDVDFSELEQRIFKLNSPRCLVATPGVRVGINGREELRGSWLLAAMLAGMKAGMLPQESLTYKLVRVLGLEGTFDLLEQEQAITLGASPVTAVPGAGFRVVLSQLAQLTSTNTLEVEPSVLHCADVVLTNLEETLGRKYTGQPVTTNIKARLNDIKFDTLQVLGEASRLGMILNDYSVTRVTYQNRTYGVELKAAIAEPGNYITILARWQAVTASV